MTTSDQNALDHNASLITFVTSEDAETMDGVLWGTEEEIERMCTAVFKCVVN